MLTYIWHNNYRHASILSRTKVSRTPYLGILVTEIHSD